MLFFKEDLQYIKDNNNGNICNKIIFIKIGLLLLMIAKLYIFLCNDKYFLYKKELYFYKNYILDCQKLKLISFEKENIYNFSYFSIVLPVYNSKKYIGSSIFSIINQSFRAFEIIIINDFSNDGTQNIIQKFQSQFSKIKIINHSSNLGIYISRVEGVLNSNGNYIIFIDSDDIFLNPFLFKKLYEFNIYYNLDIIEFIVLHQEEGKNNLFLPTDHKLNHFHNYTKKIIYQPELSNILFYEPGKLNYSEVICRTIWNKLIRKDVLLKTIKFIDTENNKKLHFNYGEDTIMNVLNFQFAINYSNIYVPGYMYNIRKISISHSNLGTENDIIICQNFFIYFKLFYKFIKYFNKNENYFLFELSKYQNYLIKLKESNSTEYILEAILFFNDVIRENNISHNLRSLIINLSKIFNENYFN
jgi:glycosyltransferase involved in cell wall biosynthesis